MNTLLSASVHFQPEPGAALQQKTGECSSGGERKEGKYLSPVGWKKLLRAIIYWNEKRFNVGSERKKKGKQLEWHILEGLLVCFHSVEALNT